MRGETILLVDDDNDLRQLLSMRLRLEGYRVHEASDGSAGAEAAMKVKPDLVIMDVVMPGKNGIETAEELLSSTDTLLIPVIVMTAFDDKSKRDSAKNCGAVAYLTKPINEDKLFGVIHSVLG
jgi:DNA-binding response OmpR family regulator